MKKLRKQASLATKTLTIRETNEPQTIGENDGAKLSDMQDIEREENHARITADNGGFYD